MPRVSVIIPTLGRGESLYACIASLRKQSFTDFEIIQETEDGELAEIRNKGLAKASGSIVILIDDDVICPCDWIANIVKVFDTFPDVGGVSGPTLIDKAHKKNRDLTRYGLIRKLYDTLFMDGQQFLPGLITKSGTPTFAAINPSVYEGEVDYLEACNMAWRREPIVKLHGFDSSYRGVGDWSEPDLAFRVRQMGHRLWFSPACGLIHNPSKQGAYHKRDKDHYRKENYLLFAKRWVKPNFKHSLYKQFLNVYFKLKFGGLV
jgi:GT2 family glycosyltransferase